MMDATIILWGFITFIIILFFAMSFLTEKPLNIVGLIASVYTASAGVMLMEVNWGSGPMIYGPYLLIVGGVIFICIYLKAIFH